MPWLPKAEAARALGVSSRTLTRGVADGMLEAKREGSDLLVHVRDEDARKLHSSTGHPAKSDRPNGSRPNNGKSQLLERLGHSDQHEIDTPTTHRDGLQSEASIAPDDTGREATNAVAEAMGAIREARAAFEETAAIAQLGAQQAVAAQQRTVQYLKVAGSVSVAAVMIAVVVAGWSTWQNARAPAGQVDQAYELDSSATDGYVMDVMAAMQETLDADRQATATMLHTIQAGISEAQGEALKDHTHPANVALPDFDKRFSELSTLLHAIEDRQHAIICEWDQLMVEHEDERIARAELTANINALMQKLTQTDPVPTLQQIIDRDWNPQH